MNARRNFQKLLRDLFEFGSADLDFGIYRILNHKRALIERWIETDLPKAIAEEFEKGALARQAEAQKALEEARQKVLKTLGAAAIDAEGNLAEQYTNTPLGKAYVEAKKRAEHAQSSDALEAAVYNHLYTFFSRYWQDGDFISKRRYSKKERYAIPYNGEEVYLYWANHDQYYVKTAEHFTDYTWKAPNGITVQFKLTAADLEVNNVKGDKRFFVPVLDGIVWSSETKTLTIPFEYRPLTKQEEKRYGSKNQQDNIIQEAVGAIPAQLKGNAETLAALNAERRRDAKGNPVSYLAHHLHQYTARNTRDFFIHKDLKGFLSRELDFYLKNEVLNLEELEAAGEGLSEGWFHLMRLIKRVGKHIIDFLSQIEEFQKALWEKKKFVTDTFYCVTVGNIAEDFYSEIADNEAQWEEWQAFFHIHELPGGLFSGNLETKEGRIAFLKAHPTLVLDTRHFSQGFTDRLLASFDNLDEVTDGLLIHGENWQALSLLLEKYRERVKCIHIDPPYNTQTSGFLYKNAYQHSSWLAMMKNRILLSFELLERSDGSFLCHIDENEYERFKLLLDTMQAPDAGTVIWDKRNPMLGKKGIATQHEYICWRSFAEKPIYRPNRNIRLILKMAQAVIRKYGGVTEEARREFSQRIRNHPGLSGGERAYQHLDEEGRVYQSVSLEAPEPRTNPKFFVPLIHPITGKPCPVPKNGWSRTPEALADLVEKGEILFGNDESVLPRRKVFLKETSQRQMASILADPKRGKNDADALGIFFPYSHPVSLYEELIGAASSNDNDAVLDYFAGSGTTGHAVINLNRQDGGRRKLILVEMGEHFDTVLLPRIKKVIFTPEWRDGKPRRLPTKEEIERSPRIVKVIRLESYEDALNNITFDEESGRKAMDLFKDEYLLRYMLKWEAKKSETLLDVEKLQSPFSYKLHIHRDGETREQAVDLPETFNCLIGLDVEKRLSLQDGDRRYLVYLGTMRDGRKAVIIWRETKDWTVEDFRRDAAFVAEQKLTEGVDELFVNGDSVIPGARPLDSVFKARLFAETEN